MNLVGFTIEKIRFYYEIMQESKYSDLTGELREFKLRK